MVGTKVFTYINSSTTSPLPSPLLTKRHALHPHGSSLGISVRPGRREDHRHGTREVLGHVASWPGETGETGRFEAKRESFLRKEKVFGLFFFLGGFNLVSFGFLWFSLVSFGLKIKRPNRNNNN